MSNMIHPRKSSLRSNQPTRTEENSPLLTGIELEKDIINDSYVINQTNPNNRPEGLIEKGEEEDNTPNKRIRSTTETMDATFNVPAVEHIDIDNQVEL